MEARAVIAWGSNGGKEEEGERERGRESALHHLRHILSTTQHHTDTHKCPCVSPSHPAIHPASAPCMEEGGDGMGVNGVGGTAFIATHREYQSHQVATLYMVRVRVRVRVRVLTLTQTPQTQTMC